MRIENKFEVERRKKRKNLIRSVIIFLAVMLTTIGIGLVIKNYL